MQKGLVVLVLVAGCFHEAPPPAPPPQQAAPLAIAAPPPMTRAQARLTLQQLSPSDLATLEELWFMYELHDASGNEDSPQRLLRRVERELAHPVIADAVAVKAALDEARRIDASIPDKAGENWDKVRSMLDPILGTVLDQGEALRRVMAFRDDIALAWLVEQYFSDSHYHAYNMHDRMFDLLVSTFGKRALPVVEDRLRKSAPLGEHHFLGKYWAEATTAGRALLGRNFDAWYQRIKGTTYEDDLAAQAVANQGTV